MNILCLWCGAPASDAPYMHHPTRYPSCTKSSTTRPKNRPDSELRSPETFSPKNHRGLASPTTLATSPQRSRSSPDALRLPATLWGWHGNPAETKSVPRYRLPSKVLTSSKIGTSLKFALSTCWQNGSRSTIATVRNPAQCAAKSMPPIPVKSETCVTPRPSALWRPSGATCRSCRLSP